MGRSTRLGAAGLAIVAFLGAAPGCARPGRLLGPAPSDALGARPSWLPDYTPAQEALLAPTTSPVAVPARPTYPLLGPFLHGIDRRLEDPRDALRVTRLFAEILERSPRSYALGDSPPELANLVAQYGPAPSPTQDTWAEARRDPHGSIYLVRRSPPPEALAALAEGARAEARGDERGAERAYEQAQALAGADAAPPRLALARLVAARDPARAEALYTEARRRDPTLAEAHEGLAELAEARGDRAAALDALAQALAYHPPSERAGALVARWLDEPEVPERPEPYAIFLEVDPMGEVRVGSLPTTGARMYAGCRAAMRYEPELRSALFEQPEREPYVLSAAEEMLCIESAIGAYLAERVASRERGERAPEDGQTHALLELAHTRGLLGYVMFEVLGQHRPEHARTAPLPVHQATVAYVRERVLGAAIDADDDARRWTASR